LLHELICFKHYGLSIFFAFYGAMFSLTLFSRIGLLHFAKSSSNYLVKATISCCSIPLSIWMVF